MLTGRVVLVTGARSELSRNLADAVTGLGAHAEVIDDRHDDRSRVERAIAAHVDVDAIVHVGIDDSALARQALDETPAAVWVATCEAVLRRALFVLQAAHRAFVERGGRVVVVTPTAGISGAARITPAVTAAEGIRAMAKSAARQWGPNGITVNCILVPLALVSAEAEECTSFLAPPAIGRLPDRHNLAAAIDLFVGAGGAGITGATLVVDGGSVMAP